MGAAAYAIPAIGGLAQGIGQGIFGQAQAKQDAKTQKAQLQQSQGQSAMQAQQSLDAAPIRDRAMYLQKILGGMTPQQFQPHDIHNQSTSAATPQYGGYDMNAIAQANQAYQPGMGNVNTAVADQFINKEGYGETTSNPLGQQTGQPTVYGGDFARAKAAQTAADPSVQAAQQAAQAQIRRVLGL